MIQDCYTAVDPDPVVADPHPYRDAAIALLLIVLFIAAFDVWKLAHHGKTISHFLQHLTGGKWWRVAFGFLVLGLLGWHVLIGFSLWDR